MLEKIVIEFDSKFFKKEHVILAAHEYTHLCWMLVDGSDEKIYAIIIPKNEDIDKEKLKDEFYNYVLAMVRE